MTFVTSLIVFLAGCALELPQAEDPLEGAVGLHLRATNLAGEPLLLVPGQKTFLQDVRWGVMQTGYPADDLVDWMAEHSAMSDQDWGGANGSPWEWEDAGDGTFGGEHWYTDAAWMTEDDGFKMRFVDGAGETTGDVLQLTTDDFVMPRRSIVEWVDGAAGEGDFGGHLGDYAHSLIVSSSGTFTGSESDLFVVEVTTGGPLDGTAVLSMSSVLGESASDLTVSSGRGISLGQGVSITFADDGTTELVAGDKWLVRADALTGEVGMPEEGPSASWSALASVFYLINDLDAQVFEVPEDAVELQIDLMGLLSVFPITFADHAGGVEFGLEVEFDLPGGTEYEPGDTVEVNLLLTDGAGNPLHEPDAMPSYGEFLAGGPDYTGIIYPSLSAFSVPCTPFTDCRLDLGEVVLAGPKANKSIRYSEADNEGYYDASVGLPETGLIFGGFADPSLWQMPISPQMSFELPEDAVPGTYYLVAKVGRSYRGERAYRIATLDIEVGGEHDDFDTPAGGCDACHVAKAELSRLRHGAADYNVCDTCHSYEHGTTAQVMHEVHFFAPQYPLRRNDCTLCHLEPGSDTRASRAVCGACHGEVHEGELDFTEDRHAECGSTCHSDQPSGHVSIPVL